MKPENVLLASSSPSGAPVSPLEARAVAERVRAYSARLAKRGEALESVSAIEERALADCRRDPERLRQLLADADRHAARERARAALRTVSGAPPSEEARLADVAARERASAQKREEDRELLEAFGGWSPEDQAELRARAEASAPAWGRARPEIVEVQVLKLLRARGGAS